ncbi:PA3496 family putative envelope integrity protein [Thalassotalea litorea]|uniref:PA3496 family putative envelope integrity protein n=1 Tax=Thalassotalea litorea TaxID=2020715 RepID=UPI003736AF27
MNSNDYDDDFETEIDDDEYQATGLAGFEIAYGSKNKQALKKAAKTKLKIKRRLDSLLEQRQLERELGSFYYDLEL